MELPLRFCSLLLSTAEVKVFFGASNSYCCNRPMFISVEPAKLHPDSFCSVLFHV